jgi:hypothetical protein
MKSSKSLPKFKTVSQVDVPHGRNGKHKQIITEILSDLAQLKDGAAMRIPLKDLNDTMANVRSALNRATRQKGIPVATATDADYLYVWKSHAAGR